LRNWKVATLLPLLQLKQTPTPIVKERAQSTVREPRQ
jgi:hypothetical protein